MKINESEPSDRELGIDHMVIEADAIVMGAGRLIPAAVSQIREFRLEQHREQQLKRIQESVGVPGTSIHTVDI